MTESEIEAFLAISALGSVSAAAEALNITQPALSRRIQTLEEELGYTLFQRDRGFRSLSLTAQGVAFRPVAERFQQLKRDALAIGNLTTKPVLRAASIGSASLYLLPDVLRRVARPSNPYNLEFHIYHSGEACRLTSLGNLDLAVVDSIELSTRSEEKKITALPIFRQRFVVMGGEGLRKSVSGQRIHPSQLNPDEEILFPFGLSFSAWHDRWFSSQTYPRIFSDHIGILPELVRGSSWSIVPLLAAQSLLREGNVILELEDAPPPQTLYAVLPARPVTGFTSHFLQLLSEQLEQLNTETAAPGS